MNYFDLHCDTPYECFFKNKNIDINDLSVSLNKGACFNKWKQTFAIWIRDDINNGFELYQNIISDIKNKLKDKCTNLTPLFSVEGGAVIDNDINLLYKLKDDGIRFLTLTWNGENKIAGGSKSNSGLKPFGKQVINKLNELNIACDLSHLNDKSFYSAIELSDFPIATHSNSRKICNHLRNLTDQQLKMISEKNGIIGLCFYPQFLGGEVYQKIYENIYHMAEISLEDNIAIGSDFDGADMDEKLSDLSKVPKLYDDLLHKGLSSTLLDKIFYNNAETFDKRFAIL